MHCPPWSCTVCYGCASSAMVTRCPPWLRVVRHGCVSSAMVVRHPPWSRIVCHGRALSTMITCHLPWSHIVHHGCMSCIVHCHSSPGHSRHPSSVIDISKHQCWGLGLVCTSKEGLFEGTDMGLHVKRDCCEAVSGGLVRMVFSCHYIRPGSCPP